MTPEDITMVRQILPEPFQFHYFPDRESLWLLAQLMPTEVSVAELRRGPLGKLADRPLVKPLIAACGGRLLRDDLCALASIGALAADNNRLVARGYQQIFSALWRDYELSLACWALERRKFAFQQVSRAGGNLVLQVGFPSDHARIFGKYTRSHWNSDKGVD